MVTEDEGTVVGTVNEDFAIESLAGDVFLLGNTSWRTKHVRGGEVVAAHAGVPVTLYKVLAFVLSGAICGFSGVMLTGQVTPDLARKTRELSAPLLAKPVERKALLAEIRARLLTSG